MEDGVLDRLNEVQPQLINDLRAFHNFEELNGRKGGAKDLPDSWITSVIPKGRGSEGIMKMLGETNEAIGPLPFIKDYLESCKGLIGRVFVVLHPPSIGSVN